MTRKTVYLQRSSRKGKKFMVNVDGKTVHFGASGYSDYTKHKDKERMKRYDARHKSRENWGKSGIKTPGFWAKWILWSAPSLEGAIRKTSSKFNLRIVRGPPKAKKRSRSRRKSRSRRR